MDGFLEALRVQRWDDHRYYHHSRINQSLHLLSAISFLFAYVMIFTDPAVAALAGWLVAMTSRQIGHFFFEPKDYDVVNQASHEYKEEIKVGYNLQRKVVLMTIWALSPLPLYFDPTLFGLFTPHTGSLEFLRHVGDDLAGRSAWAGCCSAPSNCSSRRTSRPAWYGRPRSSPTRSTTSSSTTRRRFT